MTENRPITLKTNFKTYVVKIIFIVLNMVFTVLEKVFIANLTLRLLCPKTPHPRRGGIARRKELISKQLFGCMLEFNVFRQDSSFRLITSPTAISS